MSLEGIDSCHWTGVTTQQPDIVSTQGAMCFETPTGEITPLVTCTGNGGVARLNYLYGDSSFSWSADLRFSNVYYFSGVITITNASTGTTIVGSIPINGWSEVQ